MTINPQGVYDAFRRMIVAEGGPSADLKAVRDWVDSLPAESVSQAQLAAFVAKVAAGRTKVPVPSHIAADPTTWSLAFEDDFTAPDVDPAKFCTSYWFDGAAGSPAASGEVAPFLPANVTTSNGALLITAKSQSLTFQGTPYVFTSGMASTGRISGESADRFSFQYGYVEARIKVPAQQGLRPAFWLLPVDHDDSSAEVDIMEMLATDTFSDYLTVHYKDGGGSPQQTQLQYVSPNDLGGAYHRFGLLWQAGTLKWYVDGTLVRTLTSAAVPAKPLYAILSLHVGGWGGDPDGTTVLPASLGVDYLRVWQQP